MGFDPRADPWGTAMLACACIAALGMLAIVIARLRGRYSRFGRALMGVSSAAFLGAAVVGTLERVAATRVAAADEEPTSSDDVKAEDAKADDAKAQDAKADDAKADDAKADDTKADDTKADDTKAVDAAVAPAPVEPAPAAEPLPTDPKARTTTIWKMLRAAHLVADDAKKCESPQEIATAWHSLASLVADPKDRGKAKAVVKKLEACRRRVVWARAYAIGRDRLEKRDAFVEAIAARLAAREIPAIASVSGTKHEKLRIGGRKLDSPTAEALLAEGLKDELAEIGFQVVTLTDTRKATRVELEPLPDAELAARELAPQGLDEPLALPK